LDPGDPLAAAGALGSFFAVESWQAGRGWRGLAELTDPPVLTERVDNARAVIAERAAVGADSIDPAIAASMVFLGLSTRLLAPAFGAAVLTGAVPDAMTETFWWRPVAGGPWPLATGAVTYRRSGDGARALEELVLARVLAPILDSFATTFGLSPRVLWGNVASGLGGAVAMITAARPECAADALALAEQLLELPSLRDAGEFVQPDARRGRRFFVRRSCCSFYRVPRAGTCADCALTPADVRLRQWQDALTREQ
jgi:hypothetical protein